MVAAAWLRTTVRNLMWNDLRKASRRPRRVSMELAELDAEWGKHEHELPDYLSALDACLPLLDARERTVLDQRYRRDWSREQIAAQLGLTVDGVKSLLKRTLQRLRQAVKRKLSENEQ